MSMWDSKKKKSKLLLENGRTDVWFVKSLWALCLGLIVLISSLLDVIQQSANTKTVALSTDTEIQLVHTHTSPFIKTPCTSAVKR